MIKWPQRLVWYSLALRSVVVGLMPLSNIIIVDDDSDLLYLLRELLGLLGVAHCHTYRSLAELERAGDSVLDGELAILDVNLGQGQPSGIDAYRWLRERGFAGRVVFLTGHAKSHPLVAEAARLPGTHVLEKPVGMDKLVTLVENQ